MFEGVVKISVRRYRCAKLKQQRDALQQNQIENLKKEEVSGYREYITLSCSYSLPASHIQVEASSSESWVWKYKGAEV